LLRHGLLFVDRSLVDEHDGDLVPNGVQAMTRDAPKPAAIRLQFYFCPAGGTDEDFEKIGADCHFEVTVYQEVIKTAVPGRAREPRWSGAQTKEPNQIYLCYYKGVACTHSSHFLAPGFLHKEWFNTNMANFNQGAQVEHQKFGLGTVMSSSDERIVIKFDDHGEKKFVTPMVIGSLKKSDRQPPAEKRASRARKPKVAVASQAPA
jgi:hypothetical protein